MFSMLEIIQESGWIISFSLVEGGFIAMSVGLPLIAELPMHLPQLVMDAIATQRVAKPGCPIILGTQKLPRISRQGTERC